MEKDTKIISLANMKGGVGKSTCLSILANYIFNNLQDKDIVVLDADDMQATMSMLRDNDLFTYADSKGISIEELEENDDEMSKFYDIIRVKSNDVPAQIENLMGQVDYIFIDLPGNLKQEGVVKSFMYVDTFIIPTTVNQVDWDATMKFIRELKHSVIPERKNIGLDTKMYMFLNKVKSNTTEYKSFLEIIPEIQKEIQFLDTQLPESQDLGSRTNTVRSYKVANKKKGDVIDAFCVECMDIINS